MVASFEIMVEENRKKEMKKDWVTVGNGAKDRTKVVCLPTLQYHHRGGDLTCERVSSMTDRHCLGCRLLALN